MRVSTDSGRDHRSRLTSRTFGLVILLALLFVTAPLPLIPHSFREISESIKSLFVGMTYAQWIGYIAASLGILTFAMQTMIPLRITGIGHSLGQIAFGFLTGIYPMVIQHLILFPLNCYRLFEMCRLIKAVKTAVEGNHALEWLTPFMTKRGIKAGEVLVEKAEDASRLYFIIDGCVHLPEINIDLGPGAVVGELGMLAPDRKRTRTVVCTMDGSVLEIAYNRIEQLYCQNPAFGRYFLKLSTQRLFDNIERLERVLAERDAEIKQLRTARAMIKIGRPECGKRLLVREAAGCAQAEPAIGSELGALPRRSRCT